MHKPAEGARYIGCSAQGLYPSDGKPRAHGAPHCRCPQVGYALPATPQSRRSGVMRIGFIGVGTMGRPMLANLLKKGFTATAYDIAPAALEAAAAGDLVITMLPSSSHVEAAYLGPEGVGAGIARGRLAVDMSTIDPATTQAVARALGERGARFLDAPVSGALGRAIAGTLTIMVGGAAADLEE